MKEEKNSVLLGGQAVIEGVMMRGPGTIATAVRKADGSVLVRKESFTPMSSRNRLWRLPVFRGVGGLVEMMQLGISTLNWSAEVAMDEQGPASGEEGTTGADHAKSRDKKDVLRVGATVVVALAAAIALFFVTPLFLTSWLFTVNQDPLLFNLTAGLIRLCIFLGYLGAISRIKDVKRLFMYHGAEHKTVFAYEKEKTLDAQVASRHTRFHPRCGTSFLLVVMLVAIVAFALLDTLLIMGLGHITLPIRLVAHLLLLPLVGGSAYEVIRLAARHAETLPGRIAIAPGLWLQRITTSEPDLDQLEVAVTALRAALNQDDQAAGSIATAPLHVVATTQIPANA